MPLNKTTRNVFRVRIADDNFRFTAYAFRGAVARLFLCALEGLNQHCIVDFAAKCVFNRSQINRVAIGRELNAVAQSLRYVIDKVSRRNCVSLPKSPCENELTVRVDCSPQLHVASTRILGCYLWSNVLVFAIQESPQFIKLNTTAFQVAKHAILIVSAD